MVERVSDKDEVEGPIPSTPTHISLHLITDKQWAVSSAGRVPVLHTGGQRFESATVHQ